MGCTVLCCNRFIVYSHKSYIKKQTEKVKNTSLILQYSTSKSTAVPVASPLLLLLLLGLLGLEERHCPAALYAALCSEVHKSPATWRGCVRVTCAPDTGRRARDVCARRRSWLVWLDTCTLTFTSLKVRSCRVLGRGLPAFACFSPAEAVILDWNVPLSLSSAVTELLMSEQASYVHTFILHWGGHMSFLSEWWQERIREHVTYKYPRALDGPLGHGSRICYFPSAWSMLSAKASARIV